MLYLDLDLVMESITTSRSRFTFSFHLIWTRDTEA